MATRRPTFNTGKPAIPTPREMDLRVVQQAIDSIRERFANAEQQLAFLQSVADANVATGDLTLMKQQLAALTTSLNVLVAQVGGISAGDVLFHRSMAQRPMGVQHNDTQALFAARIFGS